MSRSRPSAMASHHGRVKSSGVGRSKRVGAIVSASFGVWDVVVVVPGLYLFSNYFSPLLAAVLGAIYLIGREVYARAYVKDPAKRSAGFGMSAAPALILVLGGLAGAVWQLIGH